MDVYEFICRYLDEGKRGILATVVRKTGSAPRDVGAKMFVGEDGTTFGTVGGGGLESDARRRALEIMRNGRAGVFSAGIDGKIKETDMACGGNVEILLEPVTTKYLSLYRKTETLMKASRRGVVVTEFGKNVFAKSVLAEDMSVAGDQIHSGVLDWCRNVLYEKKPVLIGGVLAEPLPESFPLYLFGAGHVAQFVSKIAGIAEFNVTIIDDRGELANRETFPDAGAIVVGKFRDAFRGLCFTGNEYLVVMTGSHETDAEVLEESLTQPVKYVGMIGSKSKVKIILDRLRQKGIDDATIRRIHAPIGIPIHAETPQEIAISIVAELVTVRNSMIAPQGEKRMIAR